MDWRKCLKHALYYAALLTCSSCFAVWLKLAHLGHEDMARGAESAKARAQLGTSSKRQGRLSGFVDKRAVPKNIPGGCIWISHKYKFIGVKFAKVGGSSIIKALKSSLCGVNFEGAFSFKAACRDTYILDHGQRIPDDCTNFMPPARMWMKYFVFAFVRNPFSRRHSMVKYCKMGDMCEGCSKDGCGTCSTVHCNPQYPNVVSSKNESYVDYIGHTETLQADLNAILAEVDRRHRLAGGEGIQWLNKTDMTGIWVNKAQHKPSIVCPKCIESVRRNYGPDVELFGYKAPTPLGGGRN